MLLCRLACFQFHGIVDGRRGRRSSSDRGLLYELPNCFPRLSGVGDSSMAEDLYISRNPCHRLLFELPALLCSRISRKRIAKFQGLLTQIVHGREGFSMQFTFSGAILEVCMRKLVFYPDSVAFIEEEKDQFPSFKVQYVYASPPKLIMLDADGNHNETRILHAGCSC